MSHDELLDVIDKNNIVVRQALKSAVHEQGLLHRMSAVLLKRADGRYLIPTASNLKADAGGLFHSTAGHVDAGESSTGGEKSQRPEDGELQENVRRGRRIEEDARADGCGGRTAF